MTKINKEEYEVLKELDDKWKWIARDSKGDNNDNLLFAYSEKPFKRYVERWHFPGELHYIDNRLFQFIQQGDEDPWSIQELIEEYENEGTEVNKQKLIEKWELAIEAAEFYGKGKEDRLIEYMRDFVGDLSQLDEPEVLSPKWIYEHVDYEDVKGITQAFIHVDDLQNLLAQKQEEVDDYTKGWTNGIAAFVEDLHSGENLVVIEKPTIPQFVAEWIETNREKYENKFLNIRYDLYNNTIHPDIDDWIVENEEKFMRAWLDSFTVEKEQKYYALIKGHEHIQGEEKYWNYDKENKNLEVGKNKVQDDVLTDYIIQATLRRWEDLGINEDNAKFVKVEELE